MANQLKMAEVHSILTLHKRGWSFRRIGRDLGIHRETAHRLGDLRLTNQTIERLRSRLEEMLRGILVADASGPDTDSGKESDILDVIGASLEQVRQLAKDLGVSLDEEEDAVDDEEGQEMASAS